MVDQAPKTHCPYCALQCGMLLDGTHVAGDDAFPVNKGGLCLKGWTSTALLDHPDRFLKPLARDTSGALVPVSWDDALARTVAAITKTQESHGRDAVGVFGGGSLTNEKAYLLGKFARVALRTANIDYNGRFCMSSAAAAALQAFGLDRGLPFPLEDIPEAAVILLVGSNAAETMPPVMRYFQAQRRNRGQLIVVDPRRTPTAEAATMHLAIRPGTDAALANGILHVLVRDGLIDRAYIDRRTEGFGTVRAEVAAYWPERVERLTGAPEADVVRAANALGEAPAAMVLTARGPEQQSRGVDNTVSYINLALALGLVGRPYSGYGCLTGQGNGQGGREHGQKADQLPGYRRIDDPTARRHIAKVWGVPEQELPGPGLSAFELLDSIGTEGGVRALLLLGSNPLVSAPDAGRVRRRLKQLDFLAVSDFFLSETAALADVVFPSAQWAEEDGTMTNLEGRVIRRRKACDPPAGVRTDLELLSDLARLLGKGEGFSFCGPEAVFQELRRASAGGAADYAGITYERIDREQGVFWPCPSEDHPGTPRLFQDRFFTPSGRARFHAVRYRPAAEEPDEEYPLYLTTGRLVGQYQSGNQTRRVKELAGEACAEVHPSTARRYGLREGGPVTLCTRRGRAVFNLKTVAGIREDTVFVPFHWEGANLLTNPALDPTSKMPEFKVCAVRIIPSPLMGEGQREGDQ